MTAYADTVQFYLQDQLCHGLTADVYVVADRAEQEKATQGLYDAVDHARETCKHLDVNDSTSELSQLNRKGKGSHVLSPELARAFAEALKVSQWTEGAFDITYRSVSGLLTTKDYRRLRVDEGKRTLTVRSADMVIDFHQVLRGILADQMDSDLQKKGWPNNYIQMNGITVVRGRDANGPWKVSVDDQSEGHAKHALNYRVQDVGIATVALASAGPLIDPKTKQVPIADLKAVTVFAENATQAEAFATAFLILGKERSSFLMKSFPSLRVVLVDREGKFVK